MHLVDYSLGLQNIKDHTVLISILNDYIWSCQLHPSYVEVVLEKWTVILSQRSIPHPHLPILAYILWSPISCATIWRGFSLQISSYLPLDSTTNKTYSKPWFLSKSTILHGIIEIFLGKWVMKTSLIKIHNIHKVLKDNWIPTMPNIQSQTLHLLKCHFSSTHTASISMDWHFSWIWNQLLCFCWSSLTVLFLLS